MDIRNVKGLKAFAQERLDNAPAAKKIVTVYAGACLALTVAVTLIQFLLGRWIDSTSGLGSMGLRSVLSAVQTVLPIIELGLSLCLSLGYLAAMLRVARGQYVSLNTLRLGFDRFWPLLRLNLLEVLILSGAGFASLYAASILFVLTPLSNGAMEILAPILGQETILDGGFLLDEALYSQLAGAMLPAVALFGVLFTLLAVPMLFRYRMADYVLIDKPGLGAMGALRESRKMVKGNVRSLLRLDLGLWWYYAAVFGVTALGYGDQVLGMLGVTLPWSGEAVYYFFFALYQLAQLGLCIWLRNRAETTYALAYDALRPKEAPQNGVVLGNIFQM